MFPDGKGEPGQISGLCQDITEIKRAQQEAFVRLLDATTGAQPIREILLEAERLGRA
jgi:hypothetical protein